MSNVYTKETVKADIESKLSRYFGVSPQDATKLQIYKSVILTVRDILTNKRAAFKEHVKRDHSKRVYYMCMEFLVGRSLRNNLYNLMIMDAYEQAVAELGFDLSEMYEMEPDPGLGNGGLGRLAACFMDSLTTLDYPATGFSLCYEYGLFKQKIIDGNQVELPDIWLPNGEGWLVPRTDKVFNVRFGGHISEQWNNGRLEVIYEDYEEVQAVPYDMMISGYDCEAVNNLRLWRANNISNFNMNLFAKGDYARAVAQNTSAETISKVLYPSDDHMEGKTLRLVQQYFLVSASLQSILSDHLARYGSLAGLEDKISIHINDTHPALCIPELMRVLMDNHNYSWERAWDIVTKVVSYTNHTVLPEALECWNEDLFRLKLPRIHQIVSEINRRFCADLWKCYPGDWDRISRMAVIAFSNVRIANLSVVGSHAVNGVSKLHSNILKETVFHDFDKHTPEKFTNVTNGIAHRRWLCYSNPRLASMLDELIGTEYRKEPTQLENLKKYADDKTVLARLNEIKRQNKTDFAARLQKDTGISLDVDSVFDVQVKRVHEYKRQLLNLLKIANAYVTLKHNPNADIRPQTFIFGGKAAPGYYMAKDIIRSIWELGELIRKDPKARDILRVVYMEDYNVSTAERLMPASEISEQISLAGKEASGTGCMKFMINGALTLGTLDGANVEIADAVGPENIYIFGLRANEVEDLWKNGYVPIRYYHASQRLKDVIDLFNNDLDGTACSGLVPYLLGGTGVADPYMCLADFEPYIHTHMQVLRAYEDRELWAKKSLMNIASAGIFAADRSIREYADNIWHVKSLQDNR